MTADDADRGTARPRVFRRVVVLCAGLVLAGGAAWIAKIAVAAVYYQEVLGDTLRDRLGFEHGSPYVWSGSRQREVFTLHPRAGGILESAGFSDGDIVRSHTITEFYRLLAESQGETVTVTVVDGGDGVALNEREPRLIPFRVPGDVR